MCGVAGAFYCIYWSEMFGAIWENLDIYVAYVGWGLVNIDGYTRPSEIGSSVEKRGKDSSK